ncbi:AbrB family transcriptional regulator [Sulfurospirillum arcachonense]|uniref:AbrB family transcriptional regulator n=1 Tax=Sulfurospirillum arcachonense TaxID=57666 RepID=UPI000469627B|nr:AbrB family transcriptional regulator [Sulfurospirillum arcachonense]
MLKKSTPFFQVLLSLLLGLVGAIIFIYLKLPLPWLLGSITAMAIVSRIPFIPVKNPKVLSPPARTILGLMIGSAFTPSIFQSIGHYAVSLIMILPFVFIIAVCGIFYYWKILGHDKMTAFFSSMPGGLLEMVAIGESMGANVYKITLFQSTRLLLIVFSLPFIIEIVGGISLDGNRVISTPIKDVLFTDMFILVFMAIIGVFLAKKLNIFAPYMIGPMIVSMIAHLSGWVTSHPPDEIIKFVQIILGTSVGFVFRGVPFKEIITTILSTFGYFFILMCVCSLFIFIVSISTDFDLLSIILAFSPGGQAEINLIAIVVAVNLPYVALHHVFRLFLVMGIAPLFAKKFINS